MDLDKAKEIVERAVCLGVSIKNKRLSLGMTQSEFAKRIGVTSSSVCAYEKGRAYPAGYKVAILKSKYGIDVPGKEPCIHCQKVNSESKKNMNNYVICSNCDYFSQIDLHECRRLIRWQSIGKAE